MKSKIDEVKLKYTEMEDTHFISHSVLTELLDDLEQLRPYVDLGELISMGVFFIKKEYTDGLEEGTDDYEKYRLFLELLQQIKEQGDENIK